MEPYLHSPNTPSWHGAQLKHRDNFNFLPSIVTCVATVILAISVDIFSHVLDHTFFSKRKNCRVCYGILSLPI
jgi:hypothetical protein